MIPYAKQSLETMGYITLSWASMGVAALPVRKLYSPTRMAIKPTYRSLAGNGEREMSIQGFKKWLKKFDTDCDGRISRDELRDTIRAVGGRFDRWKSKQGVRSADANGNGFLDGPEIDNLVEFAKKHLGVKIVEY